MAGQPHWLQEILVKSFMQWGATRTHKRSNLQSGVEKLLPLRDEGGRSIRCVPIVTCAGNLTDTPVNLHNRPAPAQPCHWICAQGGSAATGWPAQLLPCSPANQGVCLLHKSSVTTSCEISYCSDSWSWGNNLNNNNNDIKKESSSTPWKKTNN